MSQMTLHQIALDSVQVGIDWLLQGRKGPQTLPQHLQEDSDHERQGESRHAMSDHALRTRGTKKTRWCKLTQRCSFMEFLIQGE